MAQAGQPENPPCHCNSVLGRGGWSIPLTSDDLSFSFPQGFTGVVSRALHPTFSFRLIFLYENELARLQSFSAFFRGVASPLFCILAGGCATIVVTGEVEVAVHTDCDEAIV